jgi:hypothetical protein
MRKRWILIAVLLLLSLVGTTVLIARGKEIALRLEPEVFKLLADLIIAAGIGGVATLILDEVNASRERRAANRSLLLTTLGELVGLYNEAKRVRRLLRAHAVRPDSDDANAYVLKEPYDSLLQRLNEAQLKLEAQLRLLRGSQTQYPEAARLLDLLGKSEEYLGKITGEWERRLGHFNEVQDQNSLAAFQFLSGFVGDADASMKPGFARPMADVFSILSRAIGKVA